MYRMSGQGLRDKLRRSDFSRLIGQGDKSLPVPLTAFHNGFLDDSYGVQHSSTHRLKPLSLR